MYWWPLVDMWGKRPVASACNASSRLVVRQYIRLSSSLVSEPRAGSSSRGLAIVCLVVLGMGLVERTPERCRSRWPLEVAIDWGLLSYTIFVLRRGIDWRYPRRRAKSNVSTGGDPSDACQKATKSASSWWWTTFDAICGNEDLSIVCSTRGIDQSEARGSFGKEIVGRLFVEMVKALSVKVIIQPYLQRSDREREGIAVGHNDWRYAPEQEHRGREGNQFR
jgi:hypothetical protein